MVLMASCLHKIFARSCAILLLIFLAAAPARSGESPSIGPEVSLPTLASLLKRTSPAVVAVTSTKRPSLDSGMADPSGGFPDAPLPQTLTEKGAGVIVDADFGLVVTVNHVIDNSETIGIELSDGRRLQAVILTSSEVDDLAILKVASGGLTSLKLDEANGLEVGDFVVAIGNPLGLGTTTTFGIVSAMHLSYRGIGNVDLIATDALIQPGNSGGPLLNLRGELVGINVAKMGVSQGAGLGLAIPAAAVRTLLAQARLSF